MSIAIDEPTGSVRTLRDAPSVTRSTAQVLDTWETLHARADLLRHDTQQEQQRALRDHLADLGATFTRSSVLDLLDTLAGYGFSWRDIARFCRVSVPALQKWRRGQGLKPERRRDLADIVAVVETIKKRLVNDPAAWMETPLLDSTITPGDLLAAGMPSAVVDLAGAQDSVFIEQTLTAFDANWRARRTRQGYAISADEDGHLAITIEG